MGRITIKDKTISSTGRRPYVIAEIGCNHCGDFELCLKMVRAAAECGVDAVKLQKRSNDKLFTREALSAPYGGRNSYGDTYGAHRQALDWFGRKQFAEIGELCRRLDLAFIATPFTFYDLDFLTDHDIGLDAVKIASCDLKNIPLIKAAADLGLPLIISTGGGTRLDVHRAAGAAGRITDQLALLHCVSLYPNEDRDLNLAAIELLSGIAPWAVSGFSSHHPGLLPNYTAYMLGARIFEVHFTLNRGFRGTDHGFSVEPGGLRQMCEDLRRIPLMVGLASRNRAADTESSGFVTKMGKSIYTCCHIAQGETISHEVVELRAPAAGLAPYLLDEVIGLRALRDIPAETVLTADDLV